MADGLLSLCCFLFFCSVCDDEELCWNDGERWVWNFMFLPNAFSLLRMLPLPCLCTTWHPCLHGLGRNLGWPLSSPGDAFDFSKDAHCLSGSSVAISCGVRVLVPCGCFLGLVMVYLLVPLPNPNFANYRPSGLLATPQPSVWGHNVTPHGRLVSCHLHKDPHPTLIVHGNRVTTRDSRVSSRRLGYSGTSV